MYFNLPNALLGTELNCQPEHRANYCPTSLSYPTPTRALLDDAQQLAGLSTEIIPADSQDAALRTGARAWHY